MAKIIKVDAEGATLLLDMDELLLVEDELERSFSMECGQIDLDVYVADQRFKRNRKALREQEKALADMEPLETIYYFFQDARCMAGWHAEEDKQTDEQ